MRDVLVLAIVFCSLPVCFLRPYVGMLVWSWISYMNPHMLCWGIARNFPVSQFVGLATLAGFPFTRERDKLPLERETILLLLLWMMYTLTSFFAFNPIAAWSKWSRVSKILLFTFLTIPLFIDKERLKHFLLTIVFSIGFYSIKGGIFSIITGGKYKIWGPEQSFIGDNNSMGLAMLMVLPMFFYLAREERYKPLRSLLQMAFFLTIISILFTYSRGAFLGLIAVIFLFFLKLHKRYMACLIILLGVFFVIKFAPEQWRARMATIQNYQQDASTQGRFTAWYFAWKLALDKPLIGGGFEAFTPELFKSYGFDPQKDARASHSIYFGILGEHGFITLGLFLAILASCLLSLHRLKRMFKYFPSCSWICNYCDMLQMSIIAYMVSGAFLPFAYFDLYYHIVSVVVTLKILSNKEYGVLMKERSAMSCDTTVDSRLILSS